MSDFIKIASPEIASKLVSKGFNYIIDGDMFAFAATPELLKVLNEQFSKEQFVINNKLKF